MKREKLILPDADLIYFPDFMTKVKADYFFSQILENTNWRQDSIKLFGKTHLQPRLTAFFGDNLQEYSYSGITMTADEFTPELAEIQTKTEQQTQVCFNSCLANLYRNGQDSMGWHADDEKELGNNPVIASVSLGAERIFHLKHRKDKTLKHKIRLKHGSLLLMQGPTQRHWKHQLPKTAKNVEPRINLTFRKIF